MAYLSLSRQEVNHLLNCAGTVHVEGDVDQVLGNGLANNITLVIRRILQEFLAEIVAERISHEFRKVAEGFTENHVSMFRKPFFQLFLQITTTMLILAQRCNLSLQILQANSSEPVVWEKG